jgi:battenin
VGILVSCPSFVVGGCLKWIARSWRSSIICICVFLGLVWLLFRRVGMHVILLPTNYSIHTGLGELTFLQLSTTYSPSSVAGHCVGYVLQTSNFFSPPKIYLK